MNIRTYISNLALPIGVDDPTILDLDVLTVSPATVEFQDCGVFAILQTPVGEYHLKFDQDRFEQWHNRLEACLRMGSSRNQAEMSCGKPPLRKLKITKA